VRALRFIVPLGIFAILVVFLARGLYRDPREVPSPLIDKSAPQFTLPRLDTASASFSSDSMRGKVWLLNVWGSWCITCREEHATLLRLARMNVVPIVGLDWKDPAADAKQWLSRLGDPYQVTAQDSQGLVAINYGVYGAPESFLIDKQGVIRKKFIGAITDQQIEQELVPLVQQLNRQ
jgi:cytochrome c biogenesis protein CcmG/thiol:disulfide interchange protein DsbE